MQHHWKTTLSESGAEFDDNGSVEHFGNPKREAQLVLNGSAIFDLSDRAILRVSGQDAAEFLQNQLSNDINEVDADRSQLSAYCSPKGRVLAIFRIIRSGEDFLLLLPAELAENIAQRLRMFVLRAKVTIEIDDELALFGASGPDMPTLLRDYLAQVPTVANGCASNDSSQIFVVPGIHSRYTLICSAERASELWTQLNVHAAPVGKNAIALFQILSGVSEIYEATSDSQVPQMINLRELGALNFEKGCYPGQEIVARSHYLGKQKRRTYNVSWRGEQAAAPGTRILRSEGEKSDAVGTILYSAEHPEARMEALAVLRIDSAESDEVLQLESSTDSPLARRAPHYGFISD